MYYSQLVCILMHYLSPQYDVSGVSTMFYNQPVTSTVHQLSWQEGLNYIIAATNNSVS